MTCSRRTRPPETAEDDAFRPYFRRIEGGKVRLLDDEFERLEKPVPRQILLDVDDINSHRHDARLNLIGIDAAVDAADVAVHGQRRATPRHDTATRFFPDDNVFVFIIICLDSNFRGSLCLLFIFVAARIHKRKHI